MTSSWRVLVPLACSLAGCIGDDPPDEVPDPTEPWLGDVRVHLVLPTIAPPGESEGTVLQPIDRPQLRSLVDAPTFVHHGTPDFLGQVVEDCGVETEADPQLPEGLAGSFSDIIIMGDCGPGLADFLQARDFEPFLRTRLTEVFLAGDLDFVGGFPSDFQTRIETWRATPPTVGGCYDNLDLGDLCLGCELDETSQGITGSYGEPLLGPAPRDCTGLTGRTGGFGAYNLFNEGRTALIGNLFYRAADHELGEGLTPLPPTLPQQDADNWRWEPGSQWPDVFVIVPNIDGYLSPLAGDPPGGTAPVGWHAARHSTFDSPVEWPEIADRTYVMERDDTPVLALVVDLNEEVDPIEIQDVRWYARPGQLERGLLPAEERVMRNEPNFFLFDGDEEWVMARTPPLPPVFAP